MIYYKYGTGESVNFSMKSDFLSKIVKSINQIQKIIYISDFD